MVDQTILYMMKESMTFISNIVIRLRGREEFFKQCYDFCMKNASNAREQEKNIGLSADYSREFFTLDPRLTKVVYETFEMLFKDGLVYRDKRIVNVCPNCKTALADIDTEHEERRGIFAFIKYPVVGSRGEYIIVATTRPETMLGDSAVAVNPKDERYKKYIGKKVLLPIQNKEIPVIADESVEFGIIKLLRQKGYDVEAIIETNRGAGDGGRIPTSYARSSGQAGHGCFDDTEYASRTDRW